LSSNTWANENGYGKDAIEKQLAHSPDDKIRAIYNRADFMPERRAMVQAYADWLMPWAACALGYCLAQLSMQFVKPEETQFLLDHRAVL